MRPREDLIKQLTDALDENIALKKRVDQVEKWNLDLTVERDDLKKRLEELETVIGLP